MPVRREYIARRILLAVLVVFGVLIITFTISRVIPAHPEALWVGAHPTPEQLEKARELLHLDKPYYVQFLYYLRDVLTGTLGVSYRTHMPVIENIRDSLPATLELMVVAFIIALVLGIPLGIIAGVRRDSFIDHLVRVVGVSGASLPAFWFALTLQLVFSNWLGLLPSTKRVDEIVVLTTGFKPITGFYLIDSLLQGNITVFTNALEHIILPAVALATYPLGLSARMTRALVIEVLRENYIRSALAWGLPQKLVVYKYTLKNAIVPTIAAIGMSFAYTLVGAFLVEIIFAWPGIGSYAALAMLSLDYPAILGTVIIVAVFYVFANLIVDLLQAIIDPRVEL